MQIFVTDLRDPQLQEYAYLTDSALRSKHAPAKGLYIAESANVIRTCIAAGHQPRSFLMAPRWVESMADILARFPDTPVFTAEPEVLEELTGFNLHRGPMASMHRPPLPSLSKLVNPVGKPAPTRIAIFDGMADHTNMGAAFRGAAALGVDAVLITTTSSDPLYRRSLRVSMGSAVQVPWTRVDNLLATLEHLRAAGFISAALALEDESITLDEFVAQDHNKIAVLFGSEGHGLPAAAIAAADRVVKIPMMGGVDSLNVAATAAVVFYATRPRP